MSVHDADTAAHGILEMIYHHPEGRQAGLDEAVRLVCESPITHSQKRKAILMVGGMRRHNIGVENLREQPYGIVAECQNCGMILKAPAITSKGELPIQGRAAEFRCPAAPRQP
jgi:hypothetical protein